MYTLGQLEPAENINDQC